MFDANTLRIILLRLPAESLFRFRAVCKGWCAVIDDPGFVIAHTNNQKLSSTLLLINSTGPPFYPLYSFNLDDVNFTNNGTQTIPTTPLLLSRTGLPLLLSNTIAVCNGLMLIVPANHKDDLVFKTLEIWNPLTHDRLSLVQPNIKSKKVVVGYGFGYDPTADGDYKVVVIYYKEKKHTRQTQVYSLKSASWRKIENCPFDLYNTNSRPQQGAFLNGALHWISGDEATKSSWDRITVLDLTTEKYHRLACPPLNERPEQLDALGGCLLLSYLWLGENYLDNNIDKRRFDIWVMNDYGADDSWIKLFSLKGTCVLSSLRLVAYLKNKNEALLQHSYGFSMFKAESNSLKTVSIHGICEHSKKYSAYMCVGSLFRLRDSYGRVASEKQTRKMNSNREMKITAHTKLTLCVRDVDKDHHSYFCNMSHDCCYVYNSNCYNSSSQGVKKIRLTPLYPEINFTTFSVPLDICREIFLRMPAKSLIRFRAVCNAWRAVIDDPFFVKAHANKQLSSNIIIRNSTGPPFYPLYSFDLDDLNFSNGFKRVSATPLDFTSSLLSRLHVLPMATCNGLILIAPISRGKVGYYDEISLDWDRKGTWEIWNPLTHEQLELPKQDFDSYSGLSAWGLGYDCSTDDYKAVTIHYQRDLRFLEKHIYENQTHVYSLKMDSWTRIGNCPYDSWRPIGCSVFLNGVLYWIAKDYIFALDLGTENYRQFEHPTIKVNTCKFEHRKQIDVLGGCLIVSEYFHNDCTPVFVLWVMEEDGAQFSWVKLFHTHQHNIDSHIRPVSYMKNKMQILVHNGRRHGLYLFDVKSNSWKKVSIHGLTGDLYAQVVPKNIFRIHDNCGVTGRRKGRVMKNTENMKMSDKVLTFCVRNADKRGSSLPRDDPHDSCYSLDANWYYPSSEDED